MPKLTEIKFLLFESFLRSNKVALISVDSFLAFTSSPAVATNNRKEYRYYSQIIVARKNYRSSLFSNLRHRHLFQLILEKFPWHAVIFLQTKKKSNLLFATFIFEFKSYRSIPASNSTR